jgi:thiamine kinase-like enzyme
MSQDIDRNDVLTAMRGIDLFKNVPENAVRLQRLGGLTNRNFRIDSPLGRHVLRIPGAGTSEYISRKNEAHAARSAAKVGVNAEVVHFDETSGVMLCRYVDGGVTMNAERFKDLGSVKRSAVALKRVHDDAAPFLNRFELFQMVDEYLDILAKKSAPLPDGYHDVKREAEAVRAALSARPLPIKPCHCYVIDWEYAGNNDPMWDLGDVSVEAAFGPEQDEALLEAYFGGNAPAADRGRMVLYKAMCDLLWTLWGIIQHVNQNPADDFWAYAVNRFERCEKLMGGAEFGKHLQAVRDG